MNGKTKIQFKDKLWLHVAGIVMLLLLAIVLLWHNNAHSMQATSAIAAQVRFVGEYRIGDGSWQEITEGKHIPAAKGDVTLRGKFHVYTPDGTQELGVLEGETPIAFYTNHINLTFYEGGQKLLSTDRENPLYGVSACGATWCVYSFSGDSTEPMEIVVRNPHRFGNETAVDELLDTVAIWSGFDFAQDQMESEKGQRNAGLLFLIVSLVLLGIALFSGLLHVRGSRLIWVMGMAILSAGVYMMYSLPGIQFWSESVTTNTTLVLASIMFYMLFISLIITFYLKGTKKIGVALTTFMCAVVGICLTLPMVTGMYFYDTLPIWAGVQTVVNVLLLGCLGKEFLTASLKTRCLYVALGMLCVSFGVDVVAAVLGYWCGGHASTVTFSMLFITSLVLVLRIIPENINAAVRARDLELQSSRLEAEKNMVEAELKESRVAIMLSQIQPHFIYNTLGTIERMCLKDPQKAFELVRNFSLYLRRNFSELDSVAPIRFAEELKHVEYYVNIEKVRFPDMCIEYHVEATDFVLPALSVQPLVENAIKHGLMRLESGGTVVICSYETPTHFCVEVSDDGVGFDTSAPIDGKKHVGLRNIRGRLHAIVNGELLIESEVGTGTKATILIPKEVTA